MYDGICNLGVLVFSVFLARMYMDDSVDKSGVVESSENSEPLCAQPGSEDKARVTGGGDGKVGSGERLGLIRRHAFSLEGGWSGIANVRKRRRTRKEASLSSFEPTAETSRKLVGNGPGSWNPNYSVSGQNGFMSDQDVAKKTMGPAEGNANRLNGSLDLSHSLDDDNEIVIPRRPRGSSRRKKAEIDDISETLQRQHSKKFVTFSFSVKKDNEGVQNGGKPKKKRVICEIRDREEISNGVDALMQNKKKDDDLIQNGGNLVSKVAKRRRRKRLLSVQEKQCQDSFGSESKVSTDIQGEDEENLEENAARMLSSRFDPSCTSYHSNNSESTSYSAYGASFSPPFGKRAESRLRSNKDVAGRSLRPRSRHKLKGLTRIRRHFYELNASNFNPSMAVNRKIKVFWPLDQSWYFGLVKNYDPLTKLHHIKYDDRDEEWISLLKERFKLLLLPGEKSDYGGEFGKDDKPKNKHGDNCSGGFMDSEPIISWLARSNHQGKSSSVSISGKQILSDLGMSEGSHGARNGLSGVRLRRKNKINLSGGSMVSDEPTVGQTTERTDVSCSEKSTLPRVYYRRRFHKERKEFRRLEQISSSYKLNEYNVCNGSVGMLDELNSGPDISIEEKPNDSQLEIFIEENPVDAGLEISTKEKPNLSKHDALGWTGDSFASLMLSVPPLNSGQVVLKFSELLTQVLGVYSGNWSFLPCSMLLLFTHGPVVPLWPKIRLEMLFVDSIEGLRFFVFEGCLWKAVAVVCLILSVFCDLSVSRKFSNINLPVTSIRFKLSDFHALGRQFVFLFYTYSQLNNLDWMCLDNKLRQQCVVMEELPLSKCTYSNFKSLHLVKDQCFFSSLSREQGSSEVSLQHLQPGCADRNCSSYSENGGRPSASILPVSVPALLLNLHLKLLMENNALNSWNCNAASYDCSLFEETPAIKENSKVEIDVSVISIGDDSWIKSSPKPLIDCEVYATQTSVGQESPGKTARYSSLVSTSQFAESWSAVYNRQLPSDKSDSPSPPFFLNGNSPPSISHDQVDEMHLDQKLHLEQSATDSACSLHTSNSTGFRSMWHGCGPNLSSSIENQHKNISNDRTEFMYDSFSNGSRKPRTQVSYSLPFCAYDVGLKSRSVQRRGRPYKRIESDTPCRTSEESSQRCLDASICGANVLVTVSDRCWRESGAKVMLEFLDHKEWWLLVKYSGVTRYSHKAIQFLQPGIVNRLTHAMMWKGGKDWMLEFTDRSQWNRFKEIHDECYNRNLRAASVKNIPIPGVWLIEVSDDNLVEVPFVHSSPKYYRQVGTEVDSALDPSRLVYDMDSDDEEWIKSIDTGNDKIIGISVILFEKVMDTLEKAAYRRQCSDFKVGELEQLMFGVAPVDVVKVIYDHWHRKRARKGMPLIRQFQPALWKLYQAQLEEWELASSKLPGSNNLNEKVLSRPQMFAFCLRPRGLELPNKFSKQRSQKKFSVGGQYNACLRGHDHRHVNGRRLNGLSNDEGKAFGVQSSHGYDSSAWPHSSTMFYPRSTSGSGLPSNSYESGKFIHSKYKQVKLKKMGYFNQRSSDIENGKAGLSEWGEMKKQYSTDDFPRQGPSQIGGLDYDVLRLREASSAAQRSANMARLKREKAQRMLHRAEVALHKAVVAMMTAEAIKTSEEVNRTSEEEVISVG